MHTKYFLHLLSGMLSLSTLSFAAQPARQPPQHNTPVLSASHGGRTPSMSRSASSAPAQRQVKENPTASRARLQQYVRPSAQAKALSADRQHQVKSELPQQFKRDQQAAVQVNGRIRNEHPAESGWFSQQFYDQHHYSSNYYHDEHHWRHHDWNGLSNWLGWDNQYPIYYVDGDSPLDLSSDYSPPSQEVAPPVEGDWMSLGNFAAGTNTNETAVSNMFVQLAINREGAVAGTYYNATTDQLHQLDGIIDRPSQQILWKVSDNLYSPVMSTGLYNLTQDVVPVQVHFPNGTEQNWVLVRLLEN